MTTERLALAELLEKAGDGDFLRAVAEAVLQLLMETDVESLIGVARATSARRTGLHYRNGYRDRTLDTRLGTLAPAGPQAAPGHLLSTLSGAAQNDREGPGRGDPRGLDRRRVHPPGR